MPWLSGWRETCTRARETAVGQLKQLAAESNDMLMNPQELHQTLSQLIAAESRRSVMIWGPPGVGKSSIVGQVATENDLLLTDLRLSRWLPPICADYRWPMAIDPVGCRLNSFPRKGAAFFSSMN